ncbi:MAG: hypothetical protein QXT27_05080 [Pyrobaculum sp.]
MQFLSRLARTIDQLDRIALRHQDEELKNLVDDLYRQLTVIINIIEKIYTVYTELDILIKTDLKIEPGIGLEVEPPQQQERLVDYLEKLRLGGLDPAKALAYILGTGVAQLEIQGGEVYIKPREKRDQRY